MTAPVWYPMVWGRTFRTDTWWRVLPPGLDQEGWACDVVAAVFAGGIDLAVPRFLLARLHGHWVTGVACSAADIAPSMAADERGRDLFTFVGWMADVVDEPMLPDLAEWEGSYLEWASPTYRKWVGPDWERHIVDIDGPRPSVPEPVSWKPAARQDGPSLVSAPGRIVLVPDRDRYELWSAGTASRNPFVLAVGWADQQVLEHALLTHAAVNGLVEATEVVVPSGGPDLGSEDGPAPGAEEVVAEPADVDKGRDGAPSAAAADHDRSLTRGLRHLIPGGNLWGRVERLERELATLRTELARLHARLGTAGNATGEDAAARPIAEWGQDENPDRSMDP